MNDVAELAGSPAGVHPHGAAHRSGNTGHALQARQTGVTEPPRQRHNIRAGTDVGRRAVHPHLAKRGLIQTHDHAVEPVVAHQHVRAAAKHLDLGVFVPRSNNERRQFVGVTRPKQVPRTASQLKPRHQSERSVRLYPVRKFAPPAHQPPSTHRPRPL